MTNPTRTSPETKRSWLADVVAEADRTGCRDWPWATTSNGYGHLTTEGRQRPVTHLVLVLDGKPRPPAPADHALHSCDRPVCAAPWHLRWGTQAENIQERDARGRRTPRQRQGGPSGARNGNAVLDATRVLSIRGRHAAGEAGRSIARSLGVSEGTVRNVLTGRTWSHL